MEKPMAIMSAFWLENRIIMQNIKSPKETVLSGIKFVRGLYCQRDVVAFSSGIGAERTSRSLQVL